MMAVFVVNDEAQEASNAEALAFFAEVDRAVAAAEEGQGQMRVAFDCEGVNLGRFGSIEIVALAFDSPETSVEGVFLVDVGSKGDATLRSERIAALKKICECETVKKIIHDCRMDCDALFHHCDGVRVRNVHDTSCYHAVITGMEDKNLNDVLGSNGIATNDFRDGRVYKTNPTFWATRPLTRKMIQWASGDVTQLLELADRQASGLDKDGIAKAKAKSTEFSTKVIAMSLERNLRCKVNIGGFIGTRGANIRRLQRRTGTLIYSDERNLWFVYYDSPSGLSSVKSALGY